MPTSAFISYSRVDAGFVDELCRSLEGNGRVVWIDREDLRPAALWRQELYQAIEAHDAFVFVLSPDSVRSDVCEAEVDHAVRHSKRVIPLVARDVETNAVPESLRSLNWIFMRTDAELVSGRRSLNDALDKDYEWIDEHTRLLRRAKEWEREGKIGGYLLRGEELARYEAWCVNDGKKAPTPDPIHLSFVQASRAAETKRLNEAAERLERTRRSVYALQLARVPVEGNSGSSEALRLLDNPGRCPPDLRDFAWGHLWAAGERGADESRGGFPSITGPVGGLCFIDDGGTIAVVSGSRVGMYDAASGDQTDVMFDLSSDVVAIASRPRSREIFCASQGFLGGSVDRLHADSGKVDRIAELGANSLAVSPDGALLAIGAHEEIQLWDIATVSVESRIKAHRGKVASLVFSGDGTRLVSGGWDNRARIWDVQTGEKLAEFQGHSATVIGVAFSSDGSSVISVSEKDRFLSSTGRGPAGQSPEMICWSLDGDPIARVPVEQESGIVTTLLLSPDGRTLATGDDSGSVILWDPVTLERRTVLSARGTIRSVSFSPDGRRLACGTGVESGETKEKSGEVVVWEAADWRTRVQLDGHDGQVFAVRFSPKGEELAVASGYDGGNVMQPGEVKLWDVESGEARTVFAEHDNAVLDLAYSPDGRLLALACQRQLALMDPATGELAEGFDVRESSTASARVLFSRDGAILFSGRNGEIFAAYDRRTGERLHDSRGRYPLAVSPDNRVLLADTKTFALSLWDVTEQADLQEIGSASSEVTCAAFGHESHMLGVGTTGGDVMCWNTENWQPVPSLDSHVASVSSVAVSPRGKHLAICGGERDRPGIVELWELSGSKLVRTLDGFSGPVLSVSFSNDGKRLATGGGSLRPPDGLGELIVWDIEDLGGRPRTITP